MMYYPQQQQQQLHMSYHQQQLHYHQQQQGGGGGGGGAHQQPSLVQMNSSISISNKSYGADGGEVNHHSHVMNSTTSSFATPQSAANHNPGQGQGHTGEAVQHHHPGQENSGEAVEVQGQSTQGGPPAAKKVGEVTETDEMFQFSELNLNSPEYIPARR